MLERALEFSECIVQAIDTLTSHPKYRIFHQYALSREDWTTVSLICNWLKYFRSASALMAAEKYPTLSFSFHIYCILISYVSKLEQSAAAQPYPTIVAGICACKAKLLEFFDKSTYDSEYYYFATILDPRFKDTLFELSDDLESNLFSKEWVKDCAGALEDTCDEFYASERSGYSQSKTLTRTTESEPVVTDDFLRNLKARVHRRTAYLPPSNSSRAEISKYR